MATKNQENKTYTILSIDAWAGCEKGSWEWNSWHNVGEFDGSLEKDCKIIRWFINNGYLNAKAARRVYVDDDQYNLVICAKKDHQPLFAIEKASKGYCE